ncbi:hypothetical protein [Paraliomyxa miuraensis]|uniref:hypothetical protein n=1 Tax=Paraliomyxa miuraensis TaxID=376150 RepID=UPI002252271C|nr:hypothetical protein [Paraliomyxa miuraensis]MCX4245564.1 hypothetical protein [Paraliomyxa miuraensis]
MLGRVLFGSLLAMSASGCERRGDGNDAPTPPDCDVDADPGCEAGDAGVDMGEGGMALDMGSGDSAVMDEGSGGLEPVFSELPPYGELGVQWVYLHSSNVDVTCVIEEVFEWEDGLGGATRRCHMDGVTQALSDTDFALLADRIERRAEKGQTLMPSALEFNVPLAIGDEWNNVWSQAGVELEERWTVLRTEQVETLAGTYEAAVLQLVAGYGGSSSTSTVWWVDGIGQVKVEGETTGMELKSFTRP